jgi:hypothetical protein
LLTPLAGFFTYINEVQEQDIEFITADPLYYQNVQYTNQPGQLPDTNVDPDAHKASSPTTTILYTRSFSGLTK